jgi:predicted nucleic acid-binding protein
VIFLDASAVIEWLLQSPAGVKIDQRIFSRMESLHAPHLLWELCETLTAYDATYVALAELLDAPLLTCDEKIASAPDHSANIEVV